MVCFVVALKEACRGFSHIRDAEQLGPHKRIIYTEALKRKKANSAPSPLPTWTSINVHMKPPSRCQVREQRHAHTAALLCTWAAWRSTQTDNGRTWLDTSKHIAAVNSAVIPSRLGLYWVRVSFSGRLGVTLGGQGVWYDRVRGRQGLLCVPVALFSWSQWWGKRPRVERPGRGRDSAPLHCGGQLHSGDVAQNRSAQGHSVQCRGSEIIMIGVKRGWVGWGDSHQPLQPFTTQDSKV